MAQFQKATYHPDTTNKKPMSADDIQFLKELQTELNTQDNMGNRDPRYWVVRQSETRPTTEDYADDVIVTDTHDPGSTWSYLNEFLEHLAETHEDITITGIETIQIEDENATVSCLIDAVEFLQDNGIDRYEIRHTITEDITVSDCLFLTHKDCEDYLRKYGYNHPADAHAYAMTAIRSPRYERLIKLLRTTDFNLLEQFLAVQTNT